MNKSAKESLTEKFCIEKDRMFWFKSIKNFQYQPILYYSHSCNIPITRRCALKIRNVNKAAWSTHLSKMEKRLAKINLLVNHAVKRQRNQHSSFIQFHRKMFEGRFPRWIGDSYFNFSTFECEWNLHADWLILSDGTMVKISFKLLSVMQICMDVMLKLVLF